MLSPFTMTTNARAMACRRLAYCACDHTGDAGESSRRALPFNFPALFGFAEHSDPPHAAPPRNAAARLRMTSMREKKYGRPAIARLAIR